VKGHGATAPSRSMRDSWTGQVLSEDLGSSQRGGLRGGQDPVVFGLGLKPMVGGGVWVGGVFGGDLHRDFEGLLQEEPLKIV